MGSTQGSPGSLFCNPLLCAHGLSRTRLEPVEHTWYMSVRRPPLDPDRIPGRILSLPSPGKGATRSPRACIIDHRRTAHDQARTGHSRLQYQVEGSEGSRLLGRANDHWQGGSPDRSDLAPDRNAAWSAAVVIPAPRRLRTGAGDAERPRESPARVREFGSSGSEQKPTYPDSRKG